MSRSTVVLALMAALALPALAAATPATFTALATQTSAHQKGHTLSFTETLRSGRKVIGHDVVTCSLKAPTNCRGVFTLKRGSISVFGPINFNARTNTIPITGGTKAYKRARGTLTLKDVSNHKTEQTFRFK